MLDASACIAAFEREPGGELVEPLLPRAVVSTVNWVEVLQRSVVRGAALNELRALAPEAGLTVVPFDQPQAEIAVMLRASTRAAGLSLADRACLALATRLGLPALTTDRAWADLDVGVEIRLIR